MKMGWEGLEWQRRRSKQFDERRMKTKVDGGKGRMNSERTSWWFYTICNTQAKDTCWADGCKSSSTSRPARDTDDWTWSPSTSWQSEMPFKYFTVIFLLLSMPSHQWLQAQAVSSERFWPIRHVAAELLASPRALLWAKMFLQDCVQQHGHGSLT